MLLKVLSCFPSTLYHHCRLWDKGSIRYVHSLERVRPKRRIRSNPPTRFAKKEIEIPKMYMRQTIKKISNILRYSDWASAKDELQNLPIKWDSFTINQVLKSHPPMEKAWLFFNWASRLSRFKHDQFTYTTMLDIFGEAGRISSMKFVFQQMQEGCIKIDAVTYTSLLHWLSNIGDIDGSVAMWEEMRSKGCKPTVVSYTAYMKVLFDHNRVKDAVAIYKEMLQSGLTPTCHTYTVLMEHLAESGNFKDVIQMFNGMQQAGVYPDKAACNILVEKCSKAGETRAMNLILLYMKENSLVLRYPVFVKAHETLINTRESDTLLRQVNPHIKAADYRNVEEENEYVSSADTADANSMIDIVLILDFLKRKNLIAVDCLLSGLNTKNIKVDSWILTSVIEVNGKNDRKSGALLALDYSTKVGLKMERFAYVCLIGILIRSNYLVKVVDIVNEMVKCGFSLGTYLATLLIYRLGVNKEFANSEKLFCLLPDIEKNTATYTALIAAYFASGKVVEGLDVFRTMGEKGIPVAAGTYSVLSKGLEKYGKITEAELYWKEKKKRNLRTDHLSQVAASTEEETVCNCLFAGYVSSYG
ncbi:pentatricopeptide repeat-containing protein At2g01390 [Impatiens glandulifera]|uniref:pentatricopeptide repeat-containing protein At2g01390 n=1 Tax=Impatiens glandulifera TaxID=253017 RepID=UPI001FB1150A|nr:pentatricopeptide repeat-containing protein At2g01390 [Impatiens glandulifera]